MTFLEVLKSQNKEKIEQEISQRFIRNMEYFRRTSPDLFDVLKSEPIDYNLLFDEKGLNIINLKTGELSYPSNADGHQMVNVCEELSQSPIANPKWKIYTNHIYLDKMDTSKLPITGKVCNEFIDLLHKHGGIKEYYLSRSFLPSTNIFGLLGGMFLEFIRERGVFFHSLLIFEENIDMFRVSCYFVDYEKLFENVSPKSCYLFVKDLIDKFFVRSFFSQKKITNNFLRLELKLYSSPKLDASKQVIDEEYASNSRGWGSFEDEIIGVQNTLKNISFDANAYPVLNLPQRVNAPICVVGNGASLDGLLPFIKENQDKMIIFSCGTALKPLKAYGINPDFQIEIERIDYLKDVLKEAPLGDTPLLCANMTNPEVLSLGKESYIFMRGGSSSGYLYNSKSVIEFSAPFVGNAGFALACQLGSEVLLCGLDCGYIEGLGKHASHSYYGQEGFVLPADASRVRGNFDKVVYSDSIFLLSIQNITQAIKTFNPKMALNLGEGAYIEGARATRPSEFDLVKIKKKKLVSQIKSYFTSKTRMAFNDVRTDFYIQEISDFRDELKNMFQTNVKNKRELFALIDEVNSICAKKSFSSPFVGIMFEGSLAHMSQSLMIASLHLDRDDVEAFYTDAKEVIKEALDRMMFKYRLSIPLRQK
ncbi:6-hydroxymethylpterin diphosphokinase MptE-like protein [Helicobacter cappadocius]|uniref:DUF115 domain-containing protein n=1 Tax=Helicobacter cappadocius TaxID=3063998 RepID=A0AA90PJH9_9HELI|nr:MULTISPECIES: 6-hydroxymethylpterin diphosphokinase MptE-like protein [unclassified Helicobacter]MDO7253000.1 DUF115 domain-containing protein [Helicobacter sp. faydin-H75]MDP2539011.1 DUF115 domain-containing protein [Helicobacter sp. faydin-H76]